MPELGGHSVMSISSIGSSARQSQNADKWAVELMNLVAGSRPWQTAWTINEACTQCPLSKLVRGGGGGAAAAANLYLLSDPA